MRILICSNTYPPDFVGGAELIAHYQAKCLRDKGHQVAIFAGDTSGKGERHSLRQDYYEGLPVFRVNLQERDYSPDFVNFHHARVEEYFRVLLDSLTPDVVHMHNMTGLSLGMIHLAKCKSAKVIVTLHDHWGFCFKNTLIKRPGEICQNFDLCYECMEEIHDGNQKGIPIRMRKDFMALQLSKVDRFISPSAYLANVYVKSGLSAMKMRVISYGIDVERLAKVVKSPNSGRVRFTFIGYFGSHKGIQVLVDAVRQLRRREPVSVNLVGQGELFEKIKEQVQQSGISSMVRFWGKIRNDRIEEVFRETDVFVLPSIWPENQPVTITEAMATRTPVIGSRIGGIPELVEDGLTGYLFEPGDARDLAAKMSMFIEDRTRITELGHKGFARIEDDTFRNQVEKILAVYGE